MVLDVLRNWSRVGSIEKYEHWNTISDIILQPNI